MTDKSERGRPRLAYLVSEYPALSHAFIETEIAVLRRLGAEVDTFSVRPYDPNRLLAARARDEAAGTIVLQQDIRTRAPRIALALARRAPGGLVAGFRLALRSGQRTARARVWQVFYLLEALVLWQEMDRRGLRHVHVHFANNGADIARLAVAVGEAVDGASAGWRWSLAMHGPTEFEDRTLFDLEAKVGAAASVACISDFCRSQVMRLLPPAAWDKVGMVRMAVDTARFQPSESRQDPGPLRILTVGRLVPEKGSPLLVEAMSLLTASGIAATLTVVGSGPLHDDLLAEARDRGLADRVHLLGAVGQEDLPRFYQDADVFCLPSFAEGLPVVLMEAMASGLPVVTTAVAGIPELVRDHVTGLLVPPGRSDLLAAALAEVARDPLAARELGRRGRAVVEDLHDSGRNGRELLRLLTDSTQHTG